VTNLSEEDRRELARELDAANDCLLRAAADEDDQAQREALSYGVAALCRAVSEMLRPQAPSEHPKQMRLWPDPA
jgi:hypothetical protein